MLKKGLVMVLSIILITIIAGCGTFVGSGGTSNGSGSTADQAKPTQLTKIKVSIPSASVETTDLYVAEKEGYFADAGLDVEQVTASSGPELLASLTGGSVQFANMGSTTLIQAVMKGMPLQGVSVTSDGVPYYLTISSKWAKAKGITVNSSPEQVAAAMKGARVGITQPGSSTDILLRVFLGNYNVSVDKDLTELSVGDANACVAALANDRVDAFVMWAPAPQLAAAEDGAIAWNLNQVPEFSGMLFANYVTTQKYIQENPGVVQKFTNALAKAAQFTLQHPDDAFNIVKQTMPDIDPTQLKFGFDDHLALMKDGITPSSQAYEKALKVYEFVNKGPVNVTLEQAFYLNATK